MQPTDSDSNDCVPSNIKKGAAMQLSHLIMTQIVIYQTLQVVIAIPLPIVIQKCDTKCNLDIDSNCTKCKSKLDSKSVTQTIVTPNDNTKCIREDSKRGRISPEKGVIDSDSETDYNAKNT